MEALKQQIMSALGSKVTEMVGQQFGLPQQKAEQVLPEVTPPVLSSLQGALQNPQSNVGLLTTIASQFLNDKDAAPSSGMGDLAQQLLGSQLGGVVGSLSQSLGIDSGKAQSILTAVVPMVLNFLGTKAHRAEGNDLEALGRMLGVSDGLGGLMGTLLKGSDAGSLLGGLSGLFGKK